MGGKMYYNVCVDKTFEFFANERKVSREKRIFSHFIYMQLNAKEQHQHPNEHLILLSEKRKSYKFKSDLA